MRSGQHPSANTLRPTACAHGCPRCALLGVVHMSARQPQLAGRAVEVDLRAVTPAELWWMLAGLAAVAGAPVSPRNEAKVRAMLLKAAHDMLSRYPTTLWEDKQTVMEFAEAHPTAAADDDDDDAGDGGEGKGGNEGADRGGDSAGGSRDYCPHWTTFHACLVGKKYSWHHQDTRHVVRD